MRVTLQVSDRELYAALGGDDKERRVERAEVERARDRVLDYVTRGVHVRNGDAACPPAARTLSFADKSDGSCLFGRRLAHAEINALVSLDHTAVSVRDCAFCTIGIVRAVRRRNRMLGLKEVRYAGWENWRP